jgi:hypothetical protein
VEVFDCSFAGVSASYQIIVTFCPLLEEAINFLPFVA